jgi:hypothetical protein
MDYKGRLNAVPDFGDPAPQYDAAIKLSSRGARVVLGDDSSRCAQDFRLPLPGPGIGPELP